MLWYSLEAPRRGASNEYPQHLFSWRNKKNTMGSVGNPHDRMTRCAEFVAIFSSASGSFFFRISRFILDGICSNKAQSTRKIKLFQMI